MGVLPSYGTQTRRSSAPGAELLAFAGNDGQRRAARGRGLASGYRRVTTSALDGTSSEG
jgi:hypothetical protein